MKNYKAWVRAALLRAVRTMAQAGIAVLGSKTILMDEINWAVVVSAILASGVLSVLTSLAGLPECKNGICDTEDTTKS